MNDHPVRVEEIVASIESIRPHAGAVKHSDDWYAGMNHGLTLAAKTVRLLAGSEAAPHPIEAQGSEAESVVTHPRPEDGLASTGRPTEADVTRYCEGADDPLANMLRDARKHLDEGNITSARVSLHGASLGQAYRALTRPDPSLGGEPNTIGAAELQVGQFVYNRLSMLMDAKPGEPELLELQYLTDLISDVEEYMAEILAQQARRAGLKPNPEWLRWPTYEDDT